MVSTYILTFEDIEVYMRQLKLEERAEATIQKYLLSIHAFHRWLDGRPVTKENAAMWKTQLLESGLSPSTVNGRISAVNGMFDFLGWGECRIRLLKIQHQLFRDTSRELTKAEYQRLVQAALKLGRKWLALLLETICATGIRVSEVKYITVEAARAGRATVSLKGKIRTILLPKTLCDKLLRYAKKRTSGEIFLSEDGRGLSRVRIWREMKQLCGEAAVEASKV